MSNKKTKTFGTMFLLAYLLENDSRPTQFGFRYPVAREGRPLRQWNTSSALPSMSVCPAEEVRNHHHQHSMVAAGWLLAYPPCRNETIRWHLKQSQVQIISPGTATTHILARVVAEHAWYSATCPCIFEVPRISEVPGRCIFFVIFTFGSDGTWHVQKRTLNHSKDKDIE